MEEAIKKRKDYTEKLVTLGTGYRTMTKQQKNHKENYENEQHGTHQQNGIKKYKYIQINSIW